MNKKVHFEITQKRHFEIDFYMNGKRITKNARIEGTVLGSLIPISKTEICAIHPDISPTTVEKVLGKMVKNGQIRRVGSSRNSRYIKNE